MFKNILFILFIFTTSLAYGQVVSNKVTSATDHNHIHQDSSYHCAMCQQHLFEVGEVTAINEDELHYHGVATDNTKVAFHCAGCKSHLGHYIHKDTSFQVLNSSISYNGDTEYLCTYCQMPLFNKDDFEYSHKTSSYFSKPAEDRRIALDERNRFYKVQLENETAVCTYCNANLGQVDQNNSGGLGLKVNIDSVKKKKKKRNKK